MAGTMLRAERLLLLATPCAELEDMLITRKQHLECK